MQHCPTCQELWRVLTDKTAEYVKKRDQQETAALLGNVRLFRDLDPDVKAADAVRQTATQAIDTHYGREHKQPETHD